MPERIPASTSKLVVFRAIASADHYTPTTGKTIAITISKNGATSFSNPNAGATNATEMASGFYKFTLDTTDTNTNGPLAWRGAGTGVDDVGDVFQVVNATNGGFTSLPAVAAGSSGGVPVIGTGTNNFKSDASANVTFANTSIATVTTVTNQLTAAQIATGVWQDATAGDFTVASSIGKALYIANIAPGASGGHMISGTNAGTTTLGALTVTGTTTMSDGLVVNRSSSNTSAIVATGNGTGNGATFTSGAGATGNGVNMTAASTNGNGLALTKTGTGNALAAPTTNMALAKTTNITGFNDIAATAIVSSGAITTSGGAVSTVTNTTQLNGAATVVLTDASSDAVIADAVWNAATVTYGTAGSYGLLAETNLDTNVGSRMATYTQPTGFLAATFPTTVASTTNITSVAGCAVSSIGTNVITAASIAASAFNGKGDWNVGKTGYTLTATTGLGNQTADITGSLSGSVGSVTGAVGSVTGLTASDVGAIKTQTDKFTFTVANVVDANMQRINDVTITGDGQSGTEFGV